MQICGKFLGFLLFWGLSGLHGQEVENLGSFKIPKRQSGTGRSAYSLIRQCGDSGEYKSKWQNFASNRGRSFSRHSYSQSGSDSCPKSGSCQTYEDRLDCIQHPRFDDKLFIVDIPGVYEQNIISRDCSDPGKFCRRGNGKRGTCKSSVCTRRRVLLFRPPSYYYYCDLEIPTCKCRKCSGGDRCGRPPPPPICDDGDCDPVTRRPTRPPCDDCDDDFTTRRPTRPPPCRSGDCHGDQDSDHGGDDEEFSRGSSSRYRGYLRVGGRTNGTRS